ncbi:MAG: cation transporter [Oscillospiraceae bacterium]|nr:cation transporter [Oscillospiraceae bacterium]
MDRTGLAKRVSIVCIVVNLLLCVFKIAAGIIASSGAMLSDGVHSASDVLSSFIALIGIRLAGKEADREHPYGHDRLESVASIILAMLLIITGGVIGWNGLRVVASGDYMNITVPGMLALIAAVVSIVVKEAMYWYTILAARKLDSVALRASAWDHRSDAFSSLGALVGIGGARLGVPILEPIASIIICVFILRVAAQIFMEAMRQTVDRSGGEELDEKLGRVVLSQEGVLGLDMLRTRRFGPGVYVDVEISADGNLSLTQAHEISERVHDAVEAAEPSIRHCMVHVNPEGSPNSADAGLRPADDRLWMVER